ncbi:MAG TPA: hypothetical protein VNN25_06790 [Thermoanaerobaculia bacterium]|nr:hypothetical protein [Thermoanaerobaculia bacterium]
MFELRSLGHSTAAATIVTLSLFASDLRFHATAVPDSGTVRLTWSAPGCSSAYVTGAGVRAADSEAVIHASLDGEYTLVADCGGAVRTSSAKARYRGARGMFEEWPTLADFHAANEQRRTVQNASRFAEKLHDVLQGALGFSVYEHLLPDGRLRFLTNPRELPSGRQTSETNIRNRRTAFLVDVTFPRRVPGTALIAISTAIQTRRKLESTWRPESSDDIFREHEHRLVALLPAE